MDTAELRRWAEFEGTALETGADKPLSITSRLIRFRWNGVLTVAVGDDASAKTRINLVLDALAWFLERGSDGDDTLNLLIGESDLTRGTDKRREQMDAIGTLVSALHDSPRIELWTKAGDAEPALVEPLPAEFTTATPAKWVDLMDGALESKPTGLAVDFVRAVGHPSVALYPKLSGSKSTQPWQLRIDGMEIGRLSATGGTLRLGKSELVPGHEPHTTWLRVVGPTPIEFDATTMDKAVGLVRGLIGAWSAGRPPGAVLAHGQAEHALEAHLLSGRLPLEVDGHTLRPAVPFDGLVLRAAQFPTLWGDVTRPARYLDALMADEQGRPWAIELKDQFAGGGHGSYLRAGIGQAVLYRHYIRTVEALDPWFRQFGLSHTECEAAVAFPTAAEKVKKTIELHIKVADLCGVRVLQFPVPGSLPLP